MCLWAHHDSYYVCVKDNSRFFEKLLILKSVI